MVIMRMLYKYAVLLTIVLFSVLACQKTHSSSEDVKNNLQKDSLAEILKQHNRNYPDSLRFLLTKKEWNTSSLFSIYYELGKEYRLKSDFANAVKHHQIAVDFAKKMNDTAKIIQASNQLGTDYRRVGSLSNAAKAHLSALKMAELYSKKTTIEGKKLLSFSLNGIGNVYKNMGNGDEAYAYFKRSLFLDKDLENYLGMAMNCVTIGSIREHQEQLDSAYFYYKKAMHYDSLVQSKTGIAICHNRIGQLMSKKEKWDEALYHYKSARSILTKKKDIWNRLKAENEIAWIYIKQKKYKEAYDILNRIEKIAEQRKVYSYLAQTQVLLGLLHAETGNYKLATDSYKKYIDNEERVRRISKVRAVTDSRVKFEREMSDYQIQSLSKVNKEEKKKKKFILISSIIISLLLLSLLLMSYFLFLSQRKRNLVLKKSNRIRDKLFSIISHDLKAPTIAQKMAIENINSQMEVLNNEKLKSFYHVLRENTENQITVIENLMNWTRLQSDRISYNPKAINIISVIKSEIKLYNMAASQKSIVWNKEFPNSCIVYADKQMISIVVRNLINNAVKFTKEGGTITIVCKCDEDNTSVSIIDSGVGMTEKQIESFYEEKENVEVRFGTKGEKGTGLGLILCKDLLERNGSHLTIESQIGEGTKMHFALKKITNKTS